MRYVRLIQPDSGPGRPARRAEFDGDWLVASESAYNLAPTQEVLTVVEDENRRGGFMRRGGG